MPRPFLPSASTSATTITRRVASGIKPQRWVNPSPTPQTSNPRRHELIKTRQCRCHRRYFSQLTPKPLARLHDRRDIDAIFSRSSSITLHSNKNRQKDERNKNKAAAGTPGQTVRYDLPPGTEGGGRDHKPPDERVVRLGKTLRRLSPLLPNILINPLPTDLLSPQITLHLFPSTHPHLPNVKGRVLYRAALWTVPVAWSSLPLLGNVKLQILSERMVRADSVLGGCENYRYNDDAAVDCGEERLVVRWKTSHNTPSATESSPSSSTSFSSQNNNVSASKSGVNKSLSTLLGGDAPIFLPGKEGRFEGLFIFAFDEKGRIASHTIEHADQADGWDRTAKFVSLTDWLLGKARGSLGEAATPQLAAQGCHHHHHQAYDSRRGYCRGTGEEDGYGVKGGRLCYHDGMR